MRREQCTCVLGCGSDVMHREQDDYGYAHPAASRPQRIVWIAQDSLGLSKEEIAALKERGIKCQYGGAKMDEKGNVHISDAPPDGNPAHDLIFGLA